MYGAGSHSLMDAKLLLLQAGGTIRGCLFGHLLGITHHDVRLFKEVGNGEILQTGNVLMRLPFGKISLAEEGKMDGG